MDLVIIQPDLPFYRLEFFNSLASRAHIKLIIAEERSLKSLRVANTDRIKFSLCKSKKINVFSKFYYYTLTRQDLLDIRSSNGVVLSGDFKNLTNLFLLLFCIFIRCNTIYFGHLRSGGDNKNRFAIGFMKKLWLFLFDKIILYTEEEKKRLLAQWPFSNQNNRIFGINNSTFTRAEIRKSRVKTSLYNRILFLGRATKKANIQLLIDSLDSGLINNNPELLIIGEVDEPVRRLLVEKENIRCKLLGAIVDRPTLREVISSVDCLVYPGNVGLSLVDCASYGLPVLVHDDYKKHMPEADLLMNTVSQIHFTPNDKIGLCHAINYIMSDEKARFAAAEELLCRIIDDDWSIDNMVSQFVSVLD